MSEKGHVVVAMSGGVDSSVCAALLARQGYQVTGMMLHLWSEPGKECENHCCTPQAMQAARRACQILGCDFVEVDAAELFRERIVQYFFDTYQQAETPNPCVICNPTIKWGVLLERAAGLGADLLATGHYARLKRQEDGTILLLRAVDDTKDQSYMLHRLTQEQLSKTIFPLGEYQKKDVRRLARDWGLEMAFQKDSQDLCFITDEDYRAFLAKYLPDVVHPGPITGEDGQILGMHQGLAFYTIGQRKGIRVSAPQPMYVLAKDRQGNALIVGPKESLGVKQLEVGDVHWISGRIPKQPFLAEVKVRYRAASSPGQVKPDGEARAQVIFDTPVVDAAPGQFAVFYDKDIVLGGGVILS